MVNPFKKKQVDVKPLPETSPEKDRLVFLFKGTDGHGYYGFKPDSELTLARFKVQLMLIEHMRAGMTGQEMEMVMDNIDRLNAQVLLAKDKERPALSAEIGRMTALARARMSNALHHKLLLAMAAVWVVRDDEDPISFNQDIQDYKERFFAAECEEDSAYRFFQRTGFAGLPAFTQLSEVEFQELWQNSKTNHLTMLNYLENLIPARLRQVS